MVVDFLANDVTHKRNVGALRQLTSAAAAAVKGHDSNRFQLLRAVFGEPATGSEDGGSPAQSQDAAVAAAAAPPFASYDDRLNEGQLAAVEAALSDTKALSLVQGPPGSGKTSVIVELVRRAAAGGRRLLVAAPSNMAVDLLAVRLMEADPSLR